MGHPDLANDRGLNCPGQLLRSIRTCKGSRGYPVVFAQGDTAFTRAALR
ncbi:putidacin l1 [Qipengyuania citrea LAMA 915]|uniref:Putidacin l1 n=1 Tax=Qipengyuania citrea LAMA 915 TaxID=1306953 RepID=A0A0L1KCM4_9SPHN|nr:putidacin l1 [Qipengyuania citrea LAMA 915]